MLMRTIGTASTAITALCVGCASPVVGPSEARPGAIAIEAAGLRAEWAREIDRCVWFGASGKSNMLHTVELDREIPTDGAYTFFGGCYTWVAPQNGPLGWKDADGAQRSWPPDPAMDIGPARVTGISHNFITTTGPRQLSGLVEIKTLRLDYDLHADFTYTLRNDGDHSAIAGPWITTAVGKGDLIALRAPAGATMRGWDGSSVERFKSILGDPDARGWAVVDLAKADWDGGVKVYIESAAGSAERPEIAVWRHGYWFLRRGAELEATDVARLREVGEGPVAIYIEPGSGIVEAELYGPIADITPGASHTTIERWSLIPGARGDLSVLPAESAAH